MRSVNVLLVVTLVILPRVAAAQQKYDTLPLPPICTKGAMAGSTKMDAMPGDMAMPSDDAHKALMMGMANMRSAMSAGIQAADIDVAFNCGMLPHHQGAISMARVELKYGKDPRSRKLAETIIKSQELEVKEIFAWLEKRSK